MDRADPPRGLTDISAVAAVMGGELLWLWAGLLTWAVLVERRRQQRED